MKHDISQDQEPHIAPSVTPDMSVAAGAGAILRPWACQHHPMAIVPTLIAAEPIWYPPSLAIQYHTYAKYFAYADRDGRLGRGCIWTMNIPEPGDVIKTAKNTNDTQLHRGAGGLLRYMDLDILMALSWAIVNQGARATIGMADIFRLMGVQNLADAPYREIHESLERMRRVRFGFGPDGNVAHVRGPQPRLLSEAFCHKEGKHQAITVVASEYWQHALSSMRLKELQLGAYAWLRRHHAHQPLARVILNYLTCMGNAIRGGDAVAFRIHRDVLRSRYESVVRMRDKDTQRAYTVARYSRDNSDAPVNQAMRLLVQTGMINVTWPSALSPFFTGELRMHQAPHVKFDTIRRVWVDTPTLATHLARNRSADVNWHDALRDTCNITQMTWRTAINKVVRIPAPFRQMALQAGWTHEAIALVQLFVIGVTEQIGQRHRKNTPLNRLAESCLLKQNANNWSSLGHVRICAPEDMACIELGMRWMERRERDGQSTTNQTTRQVP